MNIKFLTSCAPTSGAGRLCSLAAVFVFLSILGGMVSITFSHICLVITLLMMALSNRPLYFPPIKLPLFVFLTLTVLSMLASDVPWDGVSQIKKFFIFLFLPVTYSMLASRENASRLFQACFVLTGVASLVAVMQFILHWQVARDSGIGFYESYVGRRISGFFGHWMTFSEVTLLVVLVLISYLLFSESGKKRTRVFWVGIGLLIATSLLLSFTRSAWLAFILCSGYLVWYWKKKTFGVLIITGFILLLLAPNAVVQRVSSIRPVANPARLLMWGTGLNMIQSHPWLGVGPERVGPRFEEFTPEFEGDIPDAYYGHLHNIYIHYAAERGLPAALALIWFLTRILYDCRKSLRYVSRGRCVDRFLLHATLVSTLAVMVVGCFDLTLGDSEVLAFYLAVVALGYGAVSRVADKSSNVVRI